MTRTLAVRNKAAHVAKYVMQHRHYCLRFTCEGEYYYDDHTGLHLTEAEYTKRVWSHLMTMTARILKEFP